MPGSGAQRDPPSSPLSRRARPALASAAPAPLSRLPLPSDAKRWLATIPLLPLGLAALLAVIPTPAESALSTFQISTPRQCGPLTLNWTTPSGSIASADEPFNLVLIPTSDQNEVLSNLTFTSSGNRFVALFIPARLSLAQVPACVKKERGVLAPAALKGQSRPSPSFGGRPNRGPGHLIQSTFG